MRFDRSSTRAVSSAPMGTGPAVVVAMGMALGVGVSAASAQPGGGAGDGAEHAGAPDPAAPAGVRLGQRIALLQSRIPAASVLVLVPDGPAALRAMRHWSLGVRFPILIDDGTDAARDRITRFASAFEPDRIVRYAPEAGGEADEDADGDERAALLSAVARAWDTDGVEVTPESLRGVWEQVGWRPPGVVLTDARDPARFAGAALAAAWGQVLAVGELPLGNIDRTMSGEDLESIQRMAREACEASGASYLALGDDIDAVTIAATVPSKVPGGANAGNPTDGPNALTDALARTPDDRRWGWGGLVHGDEGEALYRAMSSIFTHPRSVFLFDGYARDFAPPYSVQAAADAWKSVGFDAVVAQAPGGGIRDWRARTGGLFERSIVQVNSSGHSSWFDLTQGRGSWRDVPSMGTPAMVFFIHSFSAQSPGAGSNIAGAWLRRGAFLYAGSVHEPFLGAFVPPGALAQRLLGGMPAGAAIRSDDAPAWKINLLGDPLFTLSRGAAALEEPPALEELIPGGVSLSGELNAALGARDLPKALRTLTLLGRWKDAADLARAALRDEGAAELGMAMDADAAAQAWPAARWAAGNDGDPLLLAVMYARLALEEAESALVVDQFWQSANPHLTHPTTLPPDPLVVALRTAIRDQCAIDDANALRRHIERLYDRDAVAAMYLQLAERATDSRQERELRRALESLR
ncbi:MAG: hypothetical protein ACTS3F_00615 [Phycisphaerales bacterium]